MDWQDIFEIGCLSVCLIGIDCDVECLESCIARQFFSRGLLLFLNLYCKNLDCQEKASYLQGKSWLICIDTALVLG